MNIVNSCSSIETIANGYESLKIIFVLKNLIPVELRQLWIEIIRYNDFQSIHDDGPVLFLHPLQQRTARMHHQLHDHPVSLQKVCHPVHRARDTDHHRFQRNPTVLQDK